MCGYSYPQLPLHFLGHFIHSCMRKFILYSSSYKPPHPTSPPTWLPSCHEKANLCQKGIKKRRGKRKVQKFTKIKRTVNAIDTVSPLHPSFSFLIPGVRYGTDYPTAHIRTPTPIAKTNIHTRMRKEILSVFYACS